MLRDALILAVIIIFGGIVSAGGWALVTYVVRRARKPAPGTNDIYPHW